MPNELYTWTVNKKRTVEEALRISRRHCQEKGHDWDIADVMAVLEETKVI